MIEFFAWYNLIFYAAIFIAVLLIFVSSFGILEIDADINVETDADIFNKVLGVLGVGKCPLSIVIFTFLLIFGGTGIVLNLIFAPFFALLSVGGALVFAVVSTKFVASVISSTIPNTESYNIKKEDLVGSYGTVVMKTTSSFGMCHVTDRYGSLHKIMTRSYHKNKSLPIGSGVLIIEYKDDVFYVEDIKDSI